MIDLIAVARSSMTSTTVSKTTDSAHASAGGLPDLASSTSVKQISSLKCTSFFALPPEIRISIYRWIIYSTANGPNHNAKFWQFHNFFLSSKTIMYEFEHEWVKIYNGRINELLAEWPLYMGSVLSPVHLSNLADTRHIRILLLGTTYKTFGSSEAFKSARHFLLRLASNVGNFTIKPVGWPQLQDNSIRTFARSPALREMVRLQEILQYMPRGRDNVRMDYWGAAVSFTPGLDVHQIKTTNRRHWQRLPDEILCHVIKHIVNSCESLEDLREWRRVLEACLSASHTFMGVLYLDFVQGEASLEWSF